MFWVFYRQIDGLIATLQPPPFILPRFSCMMWQDMCPTVHPWMIFEPCPWRRRMWILKFGKEDKAEELQKWLHDGFAASVGSHSMQGFDGLFTLKHTIDNYPEAEFYQYLQGPQLQWVFANNNFQRGEAAADPRHFCDDKDWNCTDFVWQPPFCRNKTHSLLGTSSAFVLSLQSRSYGAANC